MSSRAVAISAAAHLCEALIGSRLPIPKQAQLIDFRWASALINDRPSGDTLSPFRSRSIDLWVGSARPEPSRAGSYTHTSELSECLFRSLSKSLRERTDVVGDKHCAAMRLVAAQYCRPNV